jgi:hypothetical protein
MKMVMKFGCIKRLFFAILMLFLSVSLVCAERFSFDQFYDLVLNYLGENDEGDGLDVQDLELRLRRVYDNPIDWNRTTRQELEDLGFVSDRMIEELLFYADYYGPVRSLAELQLVNDIEQPLLLLLPSVLSVVDVVDSVRWRDAFRYMRHEMVLRSDVGFERRKGYLNGHYLGAPFRLLGRYDFEAGNNFRVGLTAESDAGEPWFAYGGRGFDLYRCYVEASNMSRVSRVVVGSYRVGFGRGLLFGQQQYGDKLSRVLNRNSSSYGLSGYGGVSEQPSLTGVAAKFELGGFSFTPFYGYTALDADTAGGEWHSFSSSGYHRSETEISRRSTLGLHTIGVNASYSQRFFNIGLTAFGGFFSLPAVCVDDWSAYDFEGDTQWGVAIDYAFYKKKVWFFGETALAQEGALATTNTLLVRPLSELQFALSHRYFSPRYHTFWGNASSSLSGVNAEHGASFAMQIPLGRAKGLSFLADVYRPLWASVSTSSLDLGYELRSQFNATFGADNALYASLRYKVRPVWHREEGWYISQSATDRVGQLYLKFSYGMPNCRFVTGGQANLAQEKIGVHFTKPSFGWLFYQDAAYDVEGVPLRLKARLALYGAPTWANRFYLYESDVPMSGYTPALYGSAFRWYLMADYKFKFGLTIALRVAQSIYSDRTTIGSSHDLINSSHRTDMHILVLYKIKHHKSR